LFIPSGSLKEFSDVARNGKLFAKTMTFFCFENGVNGKETNREIAQQVEKHKNDGAARARN